MLETEPSSGVHTASCTIAPWTITPYSTSPPIPPLLFLPPQSQDLSRLGAPFFPLKGQAALAFPFPRGHLWPESPCIGSNRRSVPKTPFLTPSLAPKPGEGKGSRIPCPRDPQNKAPGACSLADTPRLAPRPHSPFSQLALGARSSMGPPGRVRRAQARASQQVAGASSRCWGPDPGTGVGRMTCPRRGGSRGGVTGVLGNSGDRGPCARAARRGPHALPGGHTGSGFAGTESSRRPRGRGRAGSAPRDTRALPEVPSEARCPKECLGWGAVGWEGQWPSGRRAQGTWDRPEGAPLPTPRTPYRARNADFLPAS